MSSAVWLLAQQTVAAPVPTELEWGRLQDPWWVVCIPVLLAVLVYVWYMYRRDSVELNRVVAAVLVTLRVAAFLGLFVIFMKPQWRTESRRVRNSRAVLLVDTSLSMGLSDSDTSGVPGGPSRAAEVIAVLKQSPLLERLREVHDVTVMAFDQRVRQAAQLPKLVPTTPDQASGGGGDLVGDAEPTTPRIEWTTLLGPQGGQSRVSQAVRQVIDERRGEPLAGVVVFTDGAQNAGLPPAAAVQSANEAGTPVFTVGLGSNQLPVNVRVADLLAPSQAFPGDRFSVTGYIQASGMPGKTVGVELLSAPTTGGQSAVAITEAREDVILGVDGELVPVTFELMPDAVGRRTIQLRIIAPPGDRNPNDDMQEVDVNVVDRKTRVLLFAGGPMRDYRFLRNHLRRDMSSEVHVLLQTARPGVSQDADRIIGQFPRDRAEMFQYDAIVAFDPNWQKLDDQQIDLLEAWVAEQGGGLVVVAGPVFTEHWNQSPRMRVIRDLYPVEFHRRLTMFDDGRFGGEEPAPLDFTREGLEAEFLALADSGPESQRTWARFPGVYGYFSVRGPKPTATVYAWHPGSGGRGRAVLLAGQFYGSGRTFYMGSGEIWRLRELDESLFDRFYTNLIRHVAQGRLMRGSSRGLLLVEQDRYVLGNTVKVRAELRDERLEPLADPASSMQIVAPDRTVTTLELAADATRRGLYEGQFAARQEGVYRLELPLPGSDESISRRIQVRVPDSEREDPRRNDALLNEIAGGTGGIYYVGTGQLLRGSAADDKPPLVDALTDQTRTVVLFGKPQTLWDNRWMLTLVCGLLCLEWLVRRLSRLA